MDRKLDRRSLVTAASLVAGLGLVPRAIGAQATPVASPAANAVLPADLEDAIRAAIEDTMAENSIPGAVVYLGLPGYEPFVEPFGLADKAAGEPVTLDTHFRIGSITKTFVGTVILQLVDEGRLALDDTIDAWDIRVPNADIITVRQLLTMTSGLQNYTETEQFAVAMNADPAQHLEPEEVIAMVESAPLDDPGRAFHYNNTNYIILGLIAEEITGEPLEQLLQTRVFDAVGMPNSGLGVDATLPAPFARGYGTAEPEIPAEFADLMDPPIATPVATPLASPVATPDIYSADADGHYDTTEFNPAWAWAAGGAWSTLGDVATWLPALLDGATLSPELAAERMEWVPADPSIPEAGGYGLGIANLGGLIGHNGAIPGYSSLAVTEIESGLTVIVLTNLYPGSTWAITPDVQIANAAIVAAMPLLMG